MPVLIKLKHAEGDEALRKLIEQLPEEVRRHIMEDEAVQDEAVFPGPERLQGFMEHFGKDASFREVLEKVIKDSDETLQRLLSSGKFPNAKSVATLLTITSVAKSAGNILRDWDQIPGGPSPEMIMDTAAKLAMGTLLSTPDPSISTFVDLKATAALWDLCNCYLEAYESPTEEENKPN